MSLNQGKRRRSTTKRIAIVSGLRTPFAKQLTTYRKQSALDLGSLVVSEMLTRLNLDPAEIDQCVFGQVMPSLEAPNIAREIVLGTGMDPRTEAFSVSRACATSFQAAISVAEAIHAGAVEVGVAGGADSASVVPIAISPKLSEALVALSKAKTLPQRLNILKTIRPKDLLPVPPSPKEYSTGLTMGEHGEQMAKKHGISREAQDAFAHRSHTLAAKAWNEGKLDDEVMRAFVPPFDAPLTRDNVVRFDSELASYAKLRPAFDRQHGTLTAANSSPLTDGASALLLMREDKAEALGYAPLGYIRSYGFAALDPRDDMLMGPTHATPIALQRGGVTLKDMALVDMHEAFAAQILCNVKAFASDTYAREVLGLDKAIGEIDMDTFNVLGGSISFGHPFAATGARMITQTLRELNRRGGGLALTTACAAGGIGVAMVLEGA